MAMGCEILRKIPGSGVYFHVVGRSWASSFHVLMYFPVPRPPKDNMILRCATV